MTNLDLKDKKLLYELDLNSRQSNKQLAKKVGLSEMVVGYRIKRLIDQQIIEYFYPKISTRLLGYNFIKIYLRLQNITNEKEQQLINSIKVQKNILWLCTLRGKFDLAASLLVKDITNFTKEYETIFGPWENYIAEKNILILEKASIFSKAFLLPKKKVEEIIYESGQTATLDREDHHLLQILSLNGRKPVTEIAPLLNLSADTVRYRLNNLQKRKIITGFSVKIDFNQLGNSYHILQLKLQNMNPEKYQKLKTFAKFNPHVIYYIKTIGNHDIELELETTAKEELDQLLKTLRDNFANEIKDYELLEVVKEERLNYYPF